MALPLTMPGIQKQGHPVTWGLGVTWQRLLSWRPSSEGRILQRELRCKGPRAPNVSYQPLFWAKALASLAWPPFGGLIATSAYFKNTLPPKKLPLSRKGVG